MVKEISDKLKKASDKVNRKITASRLANKFQSFFKKFQKASQLAAEAESVYPPLVTQEASSSHTATDVDASTERSEENHSLLVEYKRMEGLVVLENDISSNEAETEERWKAIEEIQYQIGEIKAIYNDLAVVVHEQGTMNYGIDSYGARNAASQEKTLLMKAAKPQRSNSYIICFLVIFGFLIVIVILVVSIRKIKQLQ